MVCLTPARKIKVCGSFAIGVLGIAIASCSSGSNKTTGSTSNGNQSNPSGNGSSGSASNGDGGALGTMTVSSGGSGGAIGTGGGSGSGGSGSSGGSMNGGSSSGTKSGSSGGSGGSSGGSSSGSTTGSSGGSSADGGSSSGTTSADGGAEAGVTLGMCQPGDTTPCSSYGLPAEDGGQDIVQLGPYGAQMDGNVGTNFANDVQSSDQSGSQTCQVFATSFGEPSNVTDPLLQTTYNGVALDFSLYSVYRPANWPSTPVPVITWGNGTCAQPEGYGALLRYVASYGYFVVAANSRQVAATNGDGSHVMMRALDFAAAATKDPTSPYYDKLDMSKVGAMGHSQGGGETITVANMDSRILYALPFNGGDTGVSKPYLAVSGDMDITGASVQSMTTDINGASVAGAWLYYHNPVGMGSARGHLVLMLTPERVSQQTVAWWEMWFRNDAPSKADFVGSSCGFCGHTSDATNAYDYGHNGMLQ